MVLRYNNRIKITTTIYNIYIYIQAKGRGYKGLRSWRTNTSINSSYEMAEFLQFWFSFACHMFRKFNNIMSIYKRFESDCLRFWLK